MTVLRYDSHRRRLWIVGQRCHHGATGALLSGAAAAALLTTRRRAARLLTLAVTGGVLMAHDWHDRSVWFAPGPQNDA